MVRLTGPCSQDREDVRATGLPVATRRSGYHGRPVTIAPNDFVHLHTHSEFSLLDGLGRITDLVDTSVKHGFDSLAITDHGALYGSVAFYQAATKAGIKPIIGVETYVARRSMTDKEGKADSQPFHLVLLATDMTGYQNLCRLVTDAHIDGYYYKPRIDREHLARYSQGLVGMSACLGGEIPKALEVDDWELARRLAGEYGDILGKDRFFLELQDHGIPEQKRLNEQLLRLAPETGLPLIVTNDLHYVHQSQHESSRTSARRCSTPGASPRWWTSSCPWASCGSRTSRCPTARPSRAGCARSARPASSAATARSPPSSRRASTTSWA